MKTNKIMIRKMGQFDVKQRTKDGMFNATELLKQWNKASGLKKEVKDFLSLGQTKSFIDVLENEEVPNGGDYPYLATRGKQGGVNFGKSN